MVLDAHAIQRTPHIQPIPIHEFDSPAMPKIRRKGAKAAASHVPAREPTNGKATRRNATGASDHEEIGDGESDCGSNANDATPVGDEEDLYAVLGVERTASVADIKKAYCRAALKHHPDKLPATCEGVEREAHRRSFHAAARAYSVLSDEGKRATYDRTGVVPGEDRHVAGDAQDVDALAEGTISLEEIEAFRREYIGSAEEERDLLRIYQENKGDMLVVLDAMFFSEDNGEADAKGQATESEADTDAAQRRKRASPIDRYRAVLDAAIKRGDVPAYPAYKKNIAAALKRRSKQLAAEAVEAEAAAKDLNVKVGSKADLAALIHQRSGDRFDAMIQALEAKYGGGGKNEGKNKKKGAGKGKAAVSEKPKGKVGNEAPHEEKEEKENGKKRKAKDGPSGAKAKGKRVKAGNAK